MKSIVVSLLLFFCASLKAQVLVPIQTQYPSLFVDHGTCGYSDTHARISFGYSNFPLMGRTCLFGKPYRQFISGAGTYAAMNFNGFGGSVVGGYFSAEGFGPVGSVPFGAEIVGVYGRCDVRTSAWCVGVHGETEIYDSEPGTAIALSAEIHDLSPSGSRKDAYGLNIQPGRNMRGVVGIQLQDLAVGETSYRRLTKMPGGMHSIGFVDDTEFCTRFTGRSQLQQWVRGAPLCDSPNAVVVHQVDMNWRPGLPFANR